MSDVQRWDGMKGYVMVMTVNDAGRYVLYADHVAAVAAAQREGSNQGYLNGVATNVDNSFKAGVKAARDAVAALIDKQPTTAPGWVRRDEALAAIDALRGEA